MEDVLKICFVVNKVVLFIKRCLMLTFKLSSFHLLWLLLCACIYRHYHPDHALKFIVLFHFFFLSFLSFSPHLSLPHSPSYMYVSLSMNVCIYSTFPFFLGPSTQGVILCMTSKSISLWNFQSLPPTMTHSLAFKREMCVNKIPSTLVVCFSFLPPLLDLHYPHSLNHTTMIYIDWWPCISLQTLALFMWVQSEAIPTLWTANISCAARMK